MTEQYYYNCEIYGRPMSPVARTLSGSFSSSSSSSRRKPIKRINSYYWIGSNFSLDIIFSNVTKSVFNHFANPVIIRWKKRHRYILRWVVDDAKCIVVTATAIKPLSRICFTTLNDRIGSGRVTGSKTTGSGRVTGQKSWPGFISDLSSVECSSVNSLRLEGSCIVWNSGSNFTPLMSSPVTLTRWKRTDRLSTSSVRRTWRFASSHSSVMFSRTPAALPTASTGTMFSVDTESCLPNKHSSLGDYISLTLEC